MTKISDYPEEKWLLDETGPIQLTSRNRTARHPALDAGSILTGFRPGSPSGTKGFNGGRNDNGAVSECGPYRQEMSYIKDVLVDADALVALAKIDDSNHEKAVNLSNKLQRAGVGYCFSPFTVAEAATVLSYKTTHQSASEFLKEIRKMDIPVLELPEKYEELSDDWFLKQNKKGTSYFDCYNMTLMERYKLVAIFSFDSIYKRNGFTLLQDLKLLMKDSHLPGVAATSGSPGRWS